ncbi:ribonuclease domain-containing protein [Actinomadura rupiterrae]|uniref:ribonuclease domain-containing protein n=1 Tax=Actinomadura rupiterrae TaxID=559627 RepID=UPI0020A5BA07|nr:ribonuclease domain-containing protein [Actinomadura rupiterrae]MCP2340525.1 ribonuclease T1 [Actinomadura rupiterrae]
MNGVTVDARKRRTLLALVVVPLLALTGLAACGNGSSGGDAGASGPSQTHARTSSAIRPGSAHGTIREVPASSLPAEAQRTLKLIDAGGPFPYRKDGATFGNRERRLPDEPGGYYKEYTVPTPGAGDRGARRVIAGRGGERYYTQDHYRSFVRVSGG